MTAQKKFLIPIICFSSLCIAMDVLEKPRYPKQEAVLRILAEKKRNINKRLEQFDNQPPILLLADDDVYHGVFRQVLAEDKLLLKARDAIDANALHRAARGNAVLNLKALIEIFKKKEPYQFLKIINACTIFGKTPLHEAIEKNNHVCAGMLLLHGANLNQETSKGLTEIQLFFEIPIYQYKNARSPEEENRLFEQRINMLLLLYVYGADFNNHNKTKNAFELIKNTEAWNDTQRLKKQKIKTLITNLKLTTEFENKAKNYLYFQSLLPTDTRWNIYDFVLGRYVPRHTRL